jgi:hypothetical protein
MPNFCYENEYISKQFSFFQSCSFYKYILLSNFYKIFISNLPNNNGSAVDFYSLLILICPDFPKQIIKNYSDLYMIIYNNGDDSNGLNKGNNTINLICFFLHFSIYYFHYDYFQELEKLFEVNKNIILLKDLLANKLIVNCPIKEEFIYEILISCDNRLIKDYDLNTINTIEETKEILEKYHEEISISYMNLVEKILKNFNLSKNFFGLTDSVINKYDNFILNSENLD